MYEILSNILKDHKGDVTFNCFGVWHILIMLFIFGSIIATVLILKNKSLEVKSKTIDVVIRIVFGLYMLDFFLMPFAYGEIDLEKLPFHICTVSCLLCFLSRHNKFFSKFTLQFALLGLIGNLIYVIYPAGVGWYQIAPYSYRVIQTLLYHGFMTLYGVLILCYGGYELKFSKSYKELIVIACMTIWAMFGNFIYNNEDRVYNWFFVVRDPFYILPENISPFIMPFVIIVIIYTANILIYLTYFGIKKLLKRENKYD